MPDATGPPKVERKLAVILAADVVGYSRLMGMDEVGTLARLKAPRRELIDPKIAEHGGRVIKTTGDGILIEFPSVVGAVHCAVDIQRNMAERRGKVPNLCWTVSCKACESMGISRTKTSMVQSIGMVTVM
jgi:adenylate cyclase